MPQTRIGSPIVRAAADPNQTTDLDLAARFPPITPWPRNRNVKSGINPRIQCANLRGLMGTAIRPVPKRWNLGGIPVFQAEVPGRVRAALEFRVGTADEPLHMAGVTHLIEHLALHGLGNQ